MIRRGVLIGAAAGASALAVWAGIATWCILQSDVLSASFLVRHTAAERVYEDRIRALRTRLDQVASQKLVEQEGLESRLAQIAERQKQLEARHAALTRLRDEAGAAIGRRAPKSHQAADSSEPASAERSYSSSKPAPLTEALELRTGTVAAPAAVAPVPTPARQSGISREERLRRIEASLRAVESAQLHTLHSLRRGSEDEASQLRAVIASLGLAADRLEGGTANGGMGGPYVPLLPQRYPSSFDSAAAEAQRSLLELARLKHASAALPLGRPAGGEAELNSGFGMRLDPFTRGPAMHTGLDFRADHGAQVRATAAGRVVSAEYSGGYGRMVEIDHGKGLSTRYAHLSSIGVVPGQIVAAGDILGRVGSTGRSTGAHLHYETRIDGTPVDPQPFIRAGARLRSVNVAAAE